MKKGIVCLFALVTVATLFAGCAWEVGSGPKHVSVPPTTGQQLIDLQKAKDAGALSESEYQAQRAKVLGK